MISFIIFQKYIFPLYFDRENERNQDYSNIYIFHLKFIGLVLINCLDLLFLIYINFVFEIHSPIVIDEFKSIFLGSNFRIIDHHDFVINH